MRTAAYQRLALAAVADMSGSFELAHDVLRLVAQSVRWQRTAHAVSARFATENGGGGWAWANSAAAPAWWLATGGGGFSLGPAAPKTWQLGPPRPWPQPRVASTSTSTNAAAVADTTEVAEARADDEDDVEQEEQDDDDVEPVDTAVDTAGSPPATPRFTFEGKAASTPPSTPPASPKQARAASNHVFVTPWCAPAQTWTVARHDGPNHLGLR